MVKGLVPVGNPVGKPVGNLVNADVILKLMEPARGTRL